jgi:hypothetical protein
VLYPAGFIRNKPEAARRFLTAYLRGVRFFNDAAPDGTFIGAKGDETVAILAEYGPFKDPAVYRSFTIGFCDPSGGRGDAFTVAIGHAEGHGDDVRAVLDVLRSWPAPFDPSCVVAEAGELLRQYRVSDAVGDRYSAEFVVSEFRRHGVTYHASERDRSALYLALLSTINSGRVELLDIPELLQELRCLERRTGPSGRDCVDHPRGAHDDRANAAAGICSLLLSGPSRQLVRHAFYGGELRVVDALTGQLVDEAGSFGRVHDTSWLFDDDDDEADEPEFVTADEWLRRYTPPARGGGI